MVKATQSPGRLNRVARHVVGTSQPSPAPTGAVSLAVGALVGAGAALVWQQQQQQKRSAATEEDLPAVAGQVMSPRQSGWVAPEKPCETTAGGIDFSRSRVTFRIDLAMKPSATMSDEPPFDMNTPVIPIDCVLTVTERSTGRSEVIVLGGNCKTETVGVPANIWMAPNADFVPIYSSSKALTIKTYDRFGKAVLYSAATGDKRAGTPQSDRAVVSVEEAFDMLDIDVRRCQGHKLSTTREVVANGLANEALIARTEVTPPPEICTGSDFSPLPVLQERFPMPHMSCPYCSPHTAHGPGRI
jgi:hypothetical protein